MARLLGAKVFNFKFNIKLNDIKHFYYIYFIPNYSVELNYIKRRIRIMPFK